MRYRLSHFLLLLVFFSIFTTWVSTVVADFDYVLIFRDLVAIMAIAIATSKLGAKSVLITIFYAASLLLLFAGKDIENIELSKLRNILAFPALLLLFTNATQIDAVGTDHVLKVNAVAFYMMTVWVAGETFLLTLAPDVYASYLNTLNYGLAQKGTSVGYLGGFVTNLRAATLMVNPVQGAFVVFLAYMVMPKTKLNTICMSFVAVMTAAKIVLVALLGLHLIRTIKRPVRLAGSILFLMIAALALMALLKGMNLQADSGAQLTRNLASARLHLAGLLSGIEQLYTSTTGVKFAEIGFQAGLQKGSVPPGFESFLGGLFALGGLFGGVAFFLFLIVCLLSRSPRRLLLASLYLLLVATSDNISSPHLYTLFAITFLCGGSRFNASSVDRR